MKEGKIMGKKFLMGIAAASFAALAVSSASANVIVGTSANGLFRAEISDPVVVAQVGGQRLLGYNLIIVNTTGASNFEFVNYYGAPNTTAGNYTGITGQLHQVWELNVIPTADQDRTVGPVNEALDSHFNSTWFRDNVDFGLQERTTATENRTANTTFDANGGIGTSLTAEWVFQGGLGTDVQSLPLAYLVTLEGTAVNFNAQIWYSGNSTVGSDIFNIAFTPGSTVPEPASIALLGLGALGLLRRRVA